MSNGRATLEGFVGTLVVGDPVEVGGLSFRPLTLEGPAPEEVALDPLVAAQAEGLVEVQETGRVSELEVTSRAARGALVLEGEIVSGGSQNRTFNQTFVVAPGARLCAPTSCVERGRWDGSRRGFASSGHKCSPSVSSHLKRSVTRSLRASDGSSRRSDQMGVWSETSATLSASSALHPTDDHLAAYARTRDSLARGLQTLNGLSASPDVVGVLVGRPDGSGALEAFATPRLARSALERVLTSHLLVEEQGAPASLASDIRQLLSGAEETAAPGLGEIGEELRLERGAMSASSFLLDGRVIHLSVDWSAAR